jgi:hypothetical protein
MAERGVERAGLVAAGEEDGQSGGGAQEHGGGHGDGGGLDNDLDAVRRCNQLLSHLEQHLTGDHTDQHAYP